MRGRELLSLLHQPRQHPPTAAQVIALPQQLDFVFGHLFSSFHHSSHHRLLLCHPEKNPQANAYLCENSISVMSATFAAFFLHKAVINIHIKEQSICNYLLDFGLSKLQFNDINAFLTLLMPDSFHSWGSFRAPQSVFWVLIDVS